MEELYKKNKDFRDYVDEYCEVHKMDKETAFKQQLIRAIRLVYETKKQKHSEGYVV